METQTLEVTHRYASALADTAPQRVRSASGTIYCPVGFFLTFSPSNEVIDCRGDGSMVIGDRADFEHTRTFRFDFDQDWVRDLAATVSPVPTEPGTYVQHAHRDDPDSPVYCLSPHGVWRAWHPGEEGVRVDALPQGLVRK